MTIRKKSGFALITTYHLGIRFVEVKEFSCERCGQVWRQRKPMGSEPEAMSKLSIVRLEQCRAHLDG